MLPDRRRSLGHRIQPRRECRLQHHLPGILHSALLGQHLVQNTRSKESRSDRMADRSRLSDQMLSYSLSVFCHTIRQCNCIRALRITQRSVRIAGLSGIRKYKCLIPEFLHASQQAPHTDAAPLFFRAHRQSGSSDRLLYNRMHSIKAADPSLPVPASRQAVRSPDLRFVPGRPLSFI